MSYNYKYITHEYKYEYLRSKYEYGTSTVYYISGFCC